MKTNPGFTLTTVCGEQVLLAEGKENIDFCSIISFNETAAYLWQKMQGKDLTEEDMAEALMAEYDVEKATALADARDTMKCWADAGIAE